MKLRLPIIILIFFCSTSLNAVIRYVSPGGSLLMNGTDWLNAFPGTSLQAVINASVPGDEVWVMSGTYFTTPTNNRNIYFSMQNGVAIYGSFNGTETNLSQRSFTCGFTSVLSAEIGLPGNGDNSYHVINNSSLNNTAVLDGFTISGANANFDLLGNDNRSLGGGMLNNAANGGSCGPAIRNCLFTNNTALFGGGIFNHGQNNGNANPVISNCIFATNTAISGGAGIDNFGYNGNASPVITNSIFYNNVAANRAGAMYCWGGGNGNANPSMLNCVFVNNSAIDGGGIFSDRSNFVSGNSGTANPTVRNCIFWGNTVTGTGPQFFLLGGANFTATYSLVDLANQNAPHLISGTGTGNLFVGPTFINSSNAQGLDNCWLTSDDGLQLQVASSGIDVGDNAGLPLFDIRNFNRIFNGVVDMGAYEFNSTSLPVSLSNFYGISGRNSSRLYWSTGSELNSYLFEVQKSTDAINFEKIGEVPASVNSNGVQKYQFIIDNLMPGNYFYRLKQLDKDGRFSYSKTILLTTKENIKEVSVFPNPTMKRATLYFGNKFFSNEEFLILNSNGQIVQKIFVNGNSGFINLEGKASGVYMLVNQKLGIAIKIYKVAEGK